MWFRGDGFVVVNKKENAGKKGSGSKEERKVKAPRSWTRKDHGRGVQRGKMGEKTFKKQWFTVA